MRNIQKSTTSSFRRRENAAAIVKAPPPGALTKGPDRKFPGLHPPPGGATSPFLSTNRRFAFPILALLAALAVGLLLLLPVGPLHAQESDAIPYPENGTYPVATFTALDPEGADVVWTLGGDDASDFKIEGGVLTFAKSPNFEDPTGGGDNGALNTYNVTVQASDGRASEANLSMEKVTVMVTNVDEPGTVTLPTLQPVDGIMLIATHDDPDSITVNTAKWQWATSTDGSTYTDIVQEGAEQDATTDRYTPVAGDVGKFLRAKVTYADTQGANKTAQVVSAYVVLAARSTNTAPVFKDADDNEITDDTRDIPENTAAGQPVGEPIVASDGEGDVLTYTLGPGDDNTSFAIDRATGQLWTKDPLDAEANKNIYSVMVTATDPFTTAAASSDTITLSVTVTNVEEAPKFTAGAAAISHPENGTELDTDVYTNDIQAATYTAEDDEGGTNNRPTLTLSGADSGKFTFTSNSGSGLLAFTTAPNFESPGDANQDNAYEITVVATDSNNQTDTRDVTIRVTNMEEAGTVTLSSLQPRVGVPITASLTDMDGAVTDVEWEWFRAATNDAQDCTEGQLSQNLVPTSCYAPIKDATSDTYTPVRNDATVILNGVFLKATASYSDPHGSGKTMNAVSDNQVKVDNRNRAPKFRDQDLDTEGDQLDQERQVQENSVISDNVVKKVGETSETDDPVMATDPNDDTLTYTLGGADAASFRINPSNGQLATRGELDREVKDTYTVTVTATDPYRLSATITVTIKVTNVPEPPTVSGDATANYAENGTGPVKAYAATDDEDDKAGTALKWSLTGADAEKFSINSSGVLRFKDSPNFESAGDANGDNAYEVMVVATDSKNQTDTLDVTVTVTNVDEAGTLTLSTLQPVDGVPVTATLSDIDVFSAGTAKWKWVSSNRRTSCSFTGIQDVDNADADTDMHPTGGGDVGKFLCVMVTYTDGEGSEKTKHAVSARPVLATRSANVDPAFKDAEDMTITTTDRKVGENTASGQPVGLPVAATDPEGDILTYTLDDASADTFDINIASGQLWTKAELDRETTHMYTVTVTARDPFEVTDTSAVGTATITVTVTVTNVEEAPKVEGDDAKFVENTVITTGVASYTATDPEDGPDKLPTLTLAGPDSGKFAIGNGGGNPDFTRGELRFKDSPNFESAGDANGDNAYEVMVVATDSKNQTDTLDVTVTVTNEDEPGTVALSSVQPRVGVPITASLTDMDGAVTDVEWEWFRAATNDAQDCTEGQLLQGLVPTSCYAPIKDATSDTYTPTTKDPTDVSLFLRATASYSDPHGPGKEMSEISANGVEMDTENKAPKFLDQDTETDGDQLDQTRKVDENTTGDVGDSVGATDANPDDILTYTLGGDDAASFTIDRMTGQIAVGSGTKLDYESKDTYTVTVTATDSYQESATITVTIKVNNVDEAPEIMRAPDANVAPEFASVTTSRTVAENMVAGEDIGNPVAASDANGDTLTYALVGTDAASFNIGSATGQLMTLAVLDYEAKTTYMVTVTATDPDSASDMMTVTITVTNVDEPGRVTFWRDGADATAAAIMVGDMLGGAVDDSDGNPGDTFPIAMYMRITAANITSWQWAKSMTPDMMDSWTNIGTGGMYTVMDDDAGHYLRATATYTDGEGIGKMKDATTMMVGAVVDEPGMVTLWASSTDPLTMAPQVGETITGLVVDPDDGVTGQMWQWSRTMDTADMNSWMEITDATEAAYMVTEGDTGYYLRVMATYTDAVGTDMDMAYSMPTMMVVPVGGGDHPLVTKFDYNGNGQIDKSDVVDAINAYLDEVEGISKTDVIDLINYYLDG